jgi:GAF domain-containing protein
MTNRALSRENGVPTLERPAMTAARDRLAIAELTTTLAGDFDLPTVLEAVALDARTGFNASSAAVVLRDDSHRTGEAGVQVIAEALPRTTDADLMLLTGGPVLESAREGAVTMIADLADTEDTRWPVYRREALRAGLRGMRAFPLIVLGLPVGALVVHTGEPWGVQRPSELGHILANLAAIAISIGPHTSQRRGDTSDTVETLLQGTIVIATATGIIAELTATDPADARLQLHRLARAYQVTVSDHAEKIVTAYNNDPERFVPSALLAPPTVLPPPTHIDS